MKNTGAILFGILGILVFIFLGFIYFLNNNQQNNSNQEAIQEENVISVQGGEGNIIPAQKEEIVKSDDKDIKERFKATEIVSNNLPESIEFWTEAYCPGSDTSYDYPLDLTGNSEYLLSSCESGEIGSHDGCKTCVMSKVKLTRRTCESDTQEYIKINSKNYFISTIGCNQEVTKIYHNHSVQFIEGRPSFEYDYNFDAVNDITVVTDNAQNNSCNIYLYDFKKDKFVYNEKLSSLNCPAVDVSKKRVIHFLKYGAGNWDSMTYGYTDGKFYLIDASSSSSFEGVTNYMCNIDEKNIISGESILIDSVICGNIDFIKKVLDNTNSYDIDFKDSNNKTALDYAKEKKDFSIVRILEEGNINNK